MKEQARSTKYPTLVIDYVMISFVEANVAEVGRYLFDYSIIEELELLESSIRGFNKVLTNGFLFLHYENKGEKAVVLLEIRSKGCRYLECQVDHQWTQFFFKLMKVGENISIKSYNIKRLDIAIDGFTSDTLSTKRVQRYLNKRLVTSRFRTCRTIQETRISSSDIIGDSIYFGKRASDISVVVYDKKLETKTQDIWFRTELRFRHDWANRVIATLVENSSEFSSYISSILKRNLQFRSHTENYSEVRRRNLATWYERYLEYICQQELHCGKMKFLAS